MLSIRLTRIGKKHSPHYRIVVQEKRSKLNGKSIDIIGHYHPADADKAVVINKEKAELWISRGAQASDTVTNLLVKQGIFAEDKKVHHFFTPVKPEASAKEEPAAEAPVEAEEVAEVTEEAPAEEVATEEAVTEEATA